MIANKSKREMVSESMVDNPNGDVINEPTSEEKKGRLLRFLFWAEVIFALIPFAIWLLVIFVDSSTNKGFTCKEVSTNLFIFAFAVTISSFSKFWSETQNPIMNWARKERLWYCQIGIIVAVILLGVELALSFLYEIDIAISFSSAFGIIFASFILRREFIWGLKHIRN